jgi:hypothetical protein
MGLAVKVVFQLLQWQGRSHSLSFHRAARAAFGGAKHVNLNVREEKPNPVLKYGKAHIAPDNF